MSEENRYGIKCVHKRTIDGQEYTCHLYPAGVGFDHLPLIMEVASGPVSLAVETMQVLAGFGSGEKMNPSEVRSAFEVLAQAIVKHGGSRKVKELLDHTFVIAPGGECKLPDEFDVIFQGRPATMMKVLAWVLEVNYVPFWRGALSGVSSRWTEIMQRYLQGSSPSSSEATSPDGNSPSSESP